MGHGRNTCPKGDDEARTMRFAWYGKQNTKPQQSAMTDMLVCALQTLTPTKGATTTITTLQLTLDVQENTNTGDVKWTSTISHDNVMPQEQRHNHDEAMSTGRIDEQAGILSDATTGSMTPRSESPTNTEPHASKHEEIKVTHTPHTTRCGVVPQPAGSIPLRTNIQEVQHRLPAAAAVPISQAETAGTATAATEATLTLPSVTCDPTATAEIIVQVKEPWRRSYKAMMNMEPPMVVKAAAEAAMEMTAKYWSFKATEAVEAVITKCTQRMPLTSANPALGTVLRTLNPEATSVMWAQTKRQRKAATGSSSYVTDVTGRFSSIEQASAAWHDHYQRRKQTNATDRYCYNRTMKETVVATGSEMKELFIELDATLQQGFSKSATAVADEAGDVWYGTQCYTSAYVDQAHRAVAQWKAQTAQAQPNTTPAQTDPDLREATGRSQGGGRLITAHGWS